MLTKFCLIVLVLLCIVFTLVVITVMQNNLPLTDAPGFKDRLLTYATKNVAETNTATVYPELMIREYSYPADKLYTLLEHVVHDLKWEMKLSERAQYELHAVVTTSFWRFKDDVIIKLVPAREGHYAVYIRSSSRTGRGDLGTNTRHIMDFYAQLEKQMS